MVTVCAYCHTIIRPASEPDEPVNHGICEPCHTHFLALLGIDLNRYLDLLDAPVVLVDEEARVLSANHLAQESFHIPAGMVPSPRLCGDVFECENAERPEGCGRTVPCLSCAIRNTVMETHRTGDPVDGRPAVLTRRLRSSGAGLDLRISARREGRVVLLRIEHAGTGRTWPDRTV